MSAYLVVVSKITDPDKLNQYLAAAGSTLGGRTIEIVAAATDAKVLEGKAPGNRVVILKFPDQAAAMEWYDSPEYQAIVHLRLESTEGFGILCDGM